MRNLWGICVFALALFTSGCHNNCEVLGLCWPSADQTQTIPSMPLAQAPSATPEFPPTIAPPYDGDPLSATQLRIDDLTPLQNGIEASRLLLYGGGMKRRTVITSNTVMVVSPLGAVLANLATRWTTIAHVSPTTIDPAALSGGLAASTRYWVYAKIVAGPALLFVVSTTAPDVGLSYQSGDESALWISTFVTDSSSNIVHQSQSDLEFDYNDCSGDGNLMLNAGNAIVNTSIPVGTAVPSQAKRMRVTAALATGTVANNQCKIKPAGGSRGFNIQDDGSNTNISQGTISLVNGASFDYVCDNNSQHLTVWAQGFSF